MSRYPGVWARKMLAIGGHGEQQARLFFRTLCIPAEKETSLPVHPYNATTVRTGGHVPAVSMNQGRRRKRPAAIVRQTQHHVAKIPREHLAPGGCHHILRPGRYVHTATDAGLTVKLDETVHQRAALVMRARYVPAFSHPSRLSIHVTRTVPSAATARPSKECEIGRSSLMRSGGSKLWPPSSDRERRRSEAKSVPSGFGFARRP